MDLSIVIVNWNTRELLRNCLASLPRACSGLEYEILVVDNDSHDGSAEMVERDFPSCRVTRSGGNIGFSRANNLVLGSCRGGHIVLLNPDTVCTEGSLARLHAFAVERSDLGAVGPILTDADGNPTITYGFFPSVMAHWLGALDPLRVIRSEPWSHRVVHVPARGEPSACVDYIAGACFLMPRSALDKIGPLDERFFLYFEETDWCWRARQAGLEIWFCAEAEVAHLEGKAAEQVSLFSVRQFQKSYRQFVAKNYGPEKVSGFRLAQFAEYGMKWLLRRLAPGDRDRNRALAALHGERARLQLKSRIEVSPPA